METKNLIVMTLAVIAALLVTGIAVDVDADNDYTKEATIWTFTSGLGFDNETANAETVTYTFKDLNGNFVDDRVWTSQVPIGTTVITLNYTILGVALTDTVTIISVTDDNSDEFTGVVSYSGNGVEAVPLGALETAVGYVKNQSPYYVAAGSTVRIHAPSTSNLVCTVTGTNATGEYSNEHTIVNTHLSMNVFHSWPAIGEYRMVEVVENSQSENPATTVFKIDVKGYPKITFDSNGGSEVAPIQMYAYPAKAQAPASPTREGYTFTGWYTDENCEYAFNWNGNVVFHTTLYAGWHEDGTYTITYNANGGTAVKTEETVAEGSTVTLTSAAKDGFTFAGWYLNDEYVGTYGETFTPEADVTLTAAWNSIEPVEYTITYDPDGGLVSIEGAVLGQNVEIGVIQGNEFTLPAATKEGYSFDGWNLNNSKYGMNGDKKTATSSITLTARWNEIPAVTYEVQYQAEGFTFPTAQVPAGTSVALPSPEKEGFDFLGWYDGETNVGGAGASYTPTKTVILTAMWTAHVDPEPQPEPEEPTDTKNGTIMGLSTPVFGAIIAILVGIGIAVFVFGRRVA